MDKAQTRKAAAALGLQVAAKPDSQDICFVPAGKYTDVVRKLRPGAGRGGEIVHMDGRVLGTHDGVINFTVGQRRGLGVATGEPIYVVKVDAPNRRVVVGPREALLTGALAMGETNWLGEGTLEEACTAGLPAQARVRSTRPPTPGRLRLVDGQPGFAFDDPEEGVAPGQACVIYDPAGAGGLGKVLGGGFITRTVSAYPAEA